MLELFGWIGSILVVVSLMQARVLRFRVLNLVGAAIATVYNVWLEIWPFAAMNGVIAVIDAYWLWRLTRERHDENVYTVVEVQPDDAYLRHVLDVHAADVAKFHPSFALAGTSAAGASGPAGAAVGERGAVGAAEPAAGTVPPGRAAYLVVRGDETVGMVVVRTVADGVGRVELDYVTPRFRDFTPGEFVYRRSGVFAAHGWRTLLAEPRPESTAYLSRVGFRPAADGLWEADVSAHAA